ncbi:MAG: C40 family peptidase [Azonexus sp.]|jgi:cell wall-associated NlpC family hydrolase|nr:C40 family peptidase [Azonexus sp.]
MFKATALLLAAALVGALPATALAAGEERPPEEPISFLQRYTNATQDVILEGLKLVGVRYRLGGNDENSGLDCSGFVRLVFKDSIGRLLPRTAREMSEVGQRIDSSELKPGDLVFFNTMRRAFSHVGIYLGDNHFMHAPRTGAEVRVESMDSSYWLKRYNGARRILGGEEN